MRKFNSESFKSSSLLDLSPGEMALIECPNFRIQDSKESACRLRFKRSEDEFANKGVFSLKISKDGTNVLVTAIGKENN